MRSQPNTPLPEQQRPVWGLSSNGEETIRPECAKSFTKGTEILKGDSNSLIMNRDMGDRRSSFQLSRQSTPIQQTTFMETQKSSHELQKGIERGDINFPPPSPSTWLSGSSKIKGRLELIMF